ncbi:glycosyltransferase 87 family protein [Dactylosporangium sp. CS-033363]|uniref:glycosyltransferase 87 family protein n=1 Tax=Dactylosporangium sp. CS-033363 TaxID=3239935 RepID=UPI003D949EF8
MATDRSAPETDEGPAPRPLPIPLVGVMAGLIVLLAVVARAQLVHHQTYDFRGFLLPWWTFIDQHGGYRALQYKFSDYNVPYLYIMVALHAVAPHHPLAAIKVVSAGFDLVLAALMYLLIKYRRPGYRLAGAAALTVLLLPTVIMNGSLWAQCDAIYTAFLLGGMYSLIKRRPWLACTLFGVAYAFKQQAMFLFPILLVLALRRELPWRALVAAPAAFLLLDVPALIIGRPIGELLTIYTSQVGGYQQLALNAPSLYALLPAELAVDEIRTAGICFAGAVVLLLVTAIAASRQRLTPQRLVVAATLFAIAVPFLLPAMHERYFYAGDVLSVAVAFLAPRKLWFVPLLTQYASATTYAPFLFGAKAASPQVPALVMLAVVLVLAIHLARELYPSAPAVGPVGTAPAADEPEAAQEPAPTKAPEPAAEPEATEQRVEYVIELAGKPVEQHAEEPAERAVTPV